VSSNVLGHFWVGLTFRNQRVVSVSTARVAPEKLVILTSRRNLTSGRERNATMVKLPEQAVQAILDATTKRKQDKPQAHQMEAAWPLPPFLSTFEPCRKRPREHERVEHERTLRNGKRVTINAYVVNRGVV
jgi:hypothetical protein